MLILAIDTSTRTRSAAILRDTAVLAEVSGYEETPYSGKLFRDISVLLDRVNCRMDQIDLFAVAAGPGSFTGLRVGLTAAKAWAEVHKKPIAPISGLEAIAVGGVPNGAFADYKSRYVAPFMDARRGQLYGAIYRFSDDSKGLALDSDESILSVDEFLESVKGKLPQAVQFVSPAPNLLPPARVAELFPDARIVQVPAALAPAIGRLGLKHAKRGDLIDALRLDANYVRRSDAESKWRDD